MRELGHNCNRWTWEELCYVCRDVVAVAVIDSSAVVKYRRTRQGPLKFWSCTEHNSAFSTTPSLSKRLTIIHLTIAPDPTIMARKKKAQSENAASNAPPQPAPAASMWYSQTKPKTTEPSTSALIICRNK